MKCNLHPEADSLFGTRTKQADVIVMILKIEGADNLGAINLHNGIGQRLNCFHIVQLTEQQLPWPSTDRHATIPSRSRSRSRSRLRPLPMQPDPSTGQML